MRHTQTKVLLFEMLGLCIETECNNGNNKYLVNIAVVDSRGSAVAGRGVVIGSNSGGSSGVCGKSSGGIGSNRSGGGRGVSSNRSGRGIGSNRSGSVGSSRGSNRSGGGRGVSRNRSVSSNRGSNKGGRVSTSGGCGLSSDGVRGQGLAVALSVAVSEVSSDPLRVGAAVAILGAALGSGGAASWPLESLHRGPEEKYLGFGFEAFGVWCLVFT